MGMRRRAKSPPEHWTSIHSATIWGNLRVDCTVQTVRSGFEFTHGSGAATTALPLELAQHVPSKKVGEFIVASGQDGPNFGRAKCVAVDKVWQSTQSSRVSHRSAQASRISDICKTPRLLHLRRVWGAHPSTHHLKDIAMENRVRESSSSAGNCRQAHQPQDREKQKEQTLGTMTSKQPCGQGCRDS